MSRMNRVLWLALATFPLILAICLFVQFSSINRIVSQGYPTSKGWKEIGYSQSVGLEKWARAFNSLPTTRAKIEVLEDRRYLGALELAMFQAMERKDAFRGSPISSCF